MKSKLPLPAAIGILAVAAFTIFITWRAKAIEMALHGVEEPIELIGKPAPDFLLQSLDGRTFSLADYRGEKNLVVSFWASWCGPCRLEMPALASFYNENQKAGDFEILAICIDDDRAAAGRFALEEKLPFPVLLDSENKAATAFGVTAIPTLFVVGKDGRVKFGHLGYDAALDFQLKRELGISLAPEVGEPPHVESSH